MIARMLTRRNMLVVSAGALLSACSTYIPDGRTTPELLSQATIVSKINGVRATNGRAPLAYSAVLASAAGIQARLMASRGELSHELDGNLRERVTAVGYRGAVGENIAEGQHTLEIAIADWLESASHRATLLNTKFTEFGLGAAVSNNENTTYWSMIFGGDAAAWLSS